MILLTCQTGVFPRVQMMTRRRRRRQFAQSWSWGWTLAVAISQSSSLVPLLQSIWPDAFDWKAPSGSIFQKKNFTTPPWIFGCISLLNKLLKVVVAHETVWTDFIQNIIKALSLSLPKHFQHIRTGEVGRRMWPCHCNWNDVHWVLLSLEPPNQTL